jgi:DNA-binding transcriptional regulator YdaS (Cro superfamily)
MVKSNPVVRAIQKAGGRRQLAEKVGVTRQAVEQWIDAGVVPPGSVIAVYDITAISPHELNPIAYPRRILSESAL